MKAIRFRISRLMIVVAVVAINLAALRILFMSRRVDVLFGGGLLWATLEIGVFRAIRDRNQSRSFWLGFLGFGSIATLSFLAAVLLPQSVVGSIWRGYLVQADGLFEPVIEASSRRNGHPAVHEILFVVALTMEWLLPLVLAAVAGGFLTRRLSSGLGRKPESARVSSVT